MAKATAKKKLRTPETRPPKRLRGRLPSKNRQPPEDLPSSSREPSPPSPSPLKASSHTCDSDDSARSLTSTSSSERSGKFLRPLQGGPAHGTHVLAAVLHDLAALDADNVLRLEIQPGINTVQINGTGIGTPFPGDHFTGFIKRHVPFPEGFLKGIIRIGDSLDNGHTMTTIRTFCLFSQELIGNFPFVSAGLALENCHVNTTRLWYGDRAGTHWRKRTGILLVFCSTYVNLGGGARDGLKNCGGNFFKKISPTL